MRPKSIVAFEYIELAKLALGFAMTVTDDFFWSLLTYGGLLALVLFISRRASNVARWIYIALFVAGLMVTAWLWIAHPSALPQSSIQQIMTALSFLASFVSLWLLLSPETSNWITSSQQPERDAI